MSKQQILGLKYGFPILDHPAKGQISAPENLLKNCEIWEFKKDFPELQHVKQQKIYILKEFKTQLVAAFKELRERGLLHEIKTFEGCYELRMIRDSLTNFSVHSWAAAIDLNAKENPLKGKISWSNEFLAVMREYVDCGADFKRVDGMHFELKI